MTSLFLLTILTHLTTRVSSMNDGNTNTHFEYGSRYVGPDATQVQNPPAFAPGSSSSHNAVPQGRFDTFRTPTAPSAPYDEAPTTARYYPEIPPPSYKQASAPVAPYGATSATVPRVQQQHPYAPSTFEQNSGPPPTAYDLLAARAAAQVRSSNGPWGTTTGFTTGSHIISPPRTAVTYQQQPQQQSYGGGHNVYQHTTTQQTVITGADIVATTRAKQGSLPSHSRREQYRLVTEPLYQRGTRTTRNQYTTIENGHEVTLTPCGNDVINPGKSYLIKSHGSFMSRGGGHVTATTTDATNIQKVGMHKKENYWSAVFSGGDRKTLKLKFGKSDGSSYNRYDGSSFFLGAYERRRGSSLSFKTGLVTGENSAQTLELYCDDKSARGPKRVWIKRAESNFFVASVGNGHALTFEETVSPRTSFKILVE